MAACLLLFKETKVKKNRKQNFKFTQDEENKMANAKGEKKNTELEKKSYFLPFKSTAGHICL